MQPLLPHMPDLTLWRRAFALHPITSANRLERLTKRGKSPNTDYATRQRKQRDMNIDAALESGAQLAEGSQPGVGALDHPAVAPEPIIALDAPAGDAILDPAAFEMGTASRVVVTLVRMQFLRPPARPAPLATHRRQGVDQFLEDHRVVAVAHSQGCSGSACNAGASRSAKALARLPGSFWKDLLFRRCSNGSIASFTSSTPAKR
jgi:hypothetical protein